MTRVKVITMGDQEAFERLINDFIKDKEVIDIKYHFQPSIYQTFTVQNHCALIIYKENSND